jgi:RNA polymerase sigma-70 factor (ECF subfamily)
MSESNAILAKRVLENDDGAFAVLFGRYYERVFRVCMKILRHRQDAEDMTQETFSRAARYLERWDSRRPFEPWLVAIAGNRCRTLLASRQGHRSLNPALEPSVDSDSTGALSTLVEEVDLALDRLANEQRQAFELFHRQGLGYQEIAQYMGRPVGTIKTWIHRARGQLIQQLQDREVVYLNRADPNPGARAADEVQS